MKSRKVIHGKMKEMIHRKMKSMPCWNIDLYENDITQWGKD